MSYDPDQEFKNSTLRFYGLSTKPRKTAKIPRRRTPEYELPEVPEPPTELRDPRPQRLIYEELREYHQRLQEYARRLKQVRDFTQSLYDENTVTFRVTAHDKIIRNRKRLKVEGVFYDPEPEAEALKALRATTDEALQRIEAENAAEKKRKSEKSQESPPGAHDNDENPSEV